MGQSLQQQAREAHERRKEIVVLKKESGKGLILLSQKLYQAGYHRDHTKLGFETFDQLVSAPVESGGYELSKWTASKLITIWKHYIVGGGATSQLLSGIFEIHKLYECRKYLTTPQEFEKRIHLSMSDIEKEGKGVNDIECSHPIIKEVSRWGCQNCGYIWKYDPRESEQRKSELSEQIDEITEYLQQTFNLNILDDTNQRNRVMAKHCLQKFGGLENVKKIITIANSSEFWRNKITCFRHLYRNGIQIASTLKQKPKAI